MKSGWVTKKLGEVCEDSIRRLKEIDDSRFLYIDISSIDRVRKTVIGATEYDRTSAPGRAQQVVEAGDVLVSTVRPNLNAVAIVEGRSDFRRIASTGFCVLRAGECVIPRYIYYFTQVDEFIAPLVAVSEKAAYPSVTDKIVKNVDIPIPPLAEQKRIVAKIDAAFKKIDALKANAERNLANAKELFQSALDEAMRPKKGWVEKRLGEVCDVLAGYPFRGNAFSETGIKICGGLIITPTEIKWNECKYWDSSKGLEDYLLAADDIVMALDRPWIADGFKIGMIEENDLPCLLIQRTARLRARKVTPKYLLYLLRHPAFKKYCTFTGATVPHISHKDIERYMIPCPSLPEQKQIVKLLDHNYSRQIADCAEMRQAILREAFEGRL